MDDMVQTRIEKHLFSTPAVVMGGEVKCTGKVSKKEDIKAWITQYPAAHLYTKNRPICVG